MKRICRVGSNHPYLLQLVAKRILEAGDLDLAIEEVAADNMVAHFFTVDIESSLPQSDCFQAPTRQSPRNTAARRSTADRIDSSAW